MLSNEDEYQNKPFIITVDTEEDNAWIKSDNPTTNNLLFLERFQCLCQSYGFKVTYFVNYPAVKCKYYVNVAKKWIEDGFAEVGMHLHAWNTPNLYTDTLWKNSKGYIYEYPYEVMIKKTENMLSTLQNTFETAISSHRSGRWGLSRFYIDKLAAMGIRVDSSVTPNINWKNSVGLYRNNGGNDYRAFPSMPSILHDKDGYPQILEMPMTSVLDVYDEKINAISRIKYIRRFVSRKYPNPLLFYPSGYNVESLMRCSDHIYGSKIPYLMMAIHSSELMPGCSPLFQSEESIESLYCDLEKIFKHIMGRYHGCTVTQFAKSYSPNLFEK